MEMAGDATSGRWILHKKLIEFSISLVLSKTQALILDILHIHTIILIIYSIPGIKNVSDKKMSVQ